MNPAEQVQFLTNGRDQRISKALEHWIRTSEGFANFVERNREKIRKKCITAKSFEDLEDVRFELEVPYLLLLDNRFEVEYEKFGADKKRSPDFTITFESSLEINIEVKRIREGGLGQRYNEWREEVVDQIRKVPSSLAFAIDMVSADGTSDFIGLLERKKDGIISFIRNTISTQALGMLDDSTYEYEVPGLEGKVVLILTKPSRKRGTDETSYHGGIEPIFYTSKEPLKFGNAILEKLGQMIPGMVNILVCTSNSSTHEKDDLIDAVRSINQRIRSQDETFFVKEGFRGVDDFLSLIRNLSGVLFRTTWSEEASAVNFLWSNHQAELQIPEAIREYVTRMSAIYP